VLLTGLAAAAVFAAGLPAARGDLDPTFGSGGKVTTDFGGSEIGWGVAVQRDGRIVIAGDRLDPAGLLRTSPSRDTYPTGRSTRASEAAVS
jgi:hypothetical protein